MYLAGGYQAAKHLADLAAGGQWGQEQLNLFHARGDHGLQIDGGKHGDGRNLGGGGAFGNGLLEASAEQLPLGWLAGGRNDRDDPQLLPELGNGAQNSAFGHFPAQSMLQRRDGGIARFKLLVCLHGQLRNLARTVSCGLRRQSRSPRSAYT